VRSEGKYVLSLSTEAGCAAFFWPRMDALHSSGLEWMCCILLA